MFTDKKIGLTTKEAEMSKPNKEKKKSDGSYLRILFKNLCTPFNLVLVAIALTYLILGFIFQSTELHSFSNYTFLVVAFLNSAISIVSEFYSKHILNKMNIVDVSEYETFRDNELVKLSSDKLVQKDVFKCHIGNQIPVDGIIVSGVAEINEAILTGESVPIKKIKEEEVYAGSFIVSGAITVMATSVAEDRYISKLQQKAKESKENKTELVKAINKIIKWGMIFMIPLAILNFVKFFVTGNVIIDVIRNILAPIVGMIPCGMLLLTSVALSTGIIKLAKRKTLVQDLYSIEMLARVDTLCFDKTGTLTDGTMSVENIFVVDSKYNISNVLGSYMKITGAETPTSKAIYEKYKEYSLGEECVRTVPFSSARKWDAVEFAKSGTFILGAPEYVNAISGKDIFSDEMWEFMNNENSNARRTLLLAHTNENANDTEFRRIHPVAIISLKQNLRENVAEMVKWFYDNDVDIRVISGDSLKTVTKIAKDSGIRDYEKGASLDGMSDEELIKIVPETKIFTRVSPDQKALIVKTLKENGHTVGVTGDGVNDILAMKTADCSIAMGEGSDAARSVSNIVLLDSDFQHMPEVVREGRRVINNVQRSSTVFIMKTIMVGILTFLSIFLLAGTGYPLIHQNIEGISLGVAGLGSVLLAMEPFSQKISGSFLKNVMRTSIPAGVFLALSAIIPYVLGVLGFTDNGIVIGILSLNLASILVFMEIAKPYNVYRVISSILVAIFTVVVVGLPILIPSLESFFFVIRSSELRTFQSIDALIGVFGVMGSYLLYERIK